jgi:hypothetical protein
MTSVPPEPQSWSEPPDPETVARELREQLDAATTRIRQQLEVLAKSGSAAAPETDSPPA